MSSTSSFKRLGVKVRRSMSGMTEICDGYDSSEKENASPDRFSKSYASLLSLESTQLSPVRESPSRRKQLMGSLRRIGSLRSIRSSPLKEKARQRVEDAVELGEVPRTPTRVIKPSLALNFQQSPPDQPMFDVLRRKSSVTSSLVVQHSSPVPIPTPAKPEEPLCGVPAYPTELVPETVPKTPGPLQMALDRETHRSGTGSDSSPVHSQQRHGMSPMPSPMPGTNFGFSDDDFGLPQKEQKVSSLEPPSEPSSYFSIPVVENFAHTDSSNVRRVADRVAYAGCRDNTVSNTDASSAVSTVEADTPAAYHICIHRSNSSATRCKHHHLNNNPSHDEDTGRTLCDYCRPSKRESTGSVTSSFDIEHVVYEYNAGKRPRDHRFDRHAYFFQQAKAQNVLQMQAHPLTVSTQPTSTESAARPATPQNTWGTDGSLYDGTGYGGASGSTSGRPSISSTAPEAPAKTASDTVYSAVSLALNSAAMAQEHDSMDEIIRSYAALESKCMYGINENDTGDLVADAQADVELANEMADHSLGA